MNNNLKYVEFLQNQSQTSPSFKNLRIESDSPTMSNYFQQIINSQQSVGNKISSSETPTMKKAQSFKNHFSMYKVDQNDGHQCQQINEQYAIGELQQDLNNQNEFGKTSGQPKFENGQYELECVDIKKEDFTNSFSELKQSKDSEHFFEDNDMNDIQIQSSTDHSRILQESSQKKQRYVQGSDNSKQSKIENKKRRFDLTKQLFYDKDIECKYNQNTNSYSGNCSLHNQEIIHFLCFSCSELLCNECVNIHVGHQIQTIENSYPYCKRNIQSMLDILNQKIEKMLIHSEDLTSIQNDVIETYQQQKHEIERAYKALIQSIKAQSTELLEYCSKLYHENYDYIINQHYNLRQELSKMIESYRTIEKNMAINDQFITCDYYLKKMKLINSIINSEKASEMNQFYQQSPSSSFYLFNMNDQFKALNVSQLYQNSRLHINDQIMSHYLEREFVQLKINLGKLDLKVESQQNMINEQSQLEDRSTSRFNAESNFESPGSNKIQTKNYFMSLQSSPQSRQSFNQVQNQLSSIQKNQILKQSDLLFQKCNKFQTQENFNQQEQQFKRTFLPTHIQNKIQQLKLFDKSNQNQQYYISPGHSQQDHFLQENDLNQPYEAQQSLNHYASTACILNSEPYQNQISQITSNYKNQPFKDKFKLEIKTQNTFLNASNLTNLSNNSSRNIIATTKSHSPNKFILNEISENTNSLSSNNREARIILSSPNQENPLLQINSEKAEKDISSRDSLGSNNQYNYLDDKQRLKLSMSPIQELKHDLFTISRRNRSFILPDQNKEGNGASKYNKEIEEIKSLLYQEPSQHLKKTPRNQHITQNKGNNKSQSPINSLFNSNFSNKDCENKVYTKSQYQNDKNSSFIGKAAPREDRDKSPNFFQYKNQLQNFNAQTETVSCLTPKYDNTIGSIYNQAQNEKFLNSHYQLEGILNTIGKTDNNKLYAQNVTSKVKNHSNLENIVQNQQCSSNLSPNSQSFLHFLSKNCTPLSTKVASKQSIRSLSNHQFDDSPLNKFQKGKMTEQLVQNFIKQKFQNQFVEGKKEQK